MGIYLELGVNESLKIARHFLDAVCNQRFGSANF